MSLIRKQLHLNPYDYHKYLINEYVLKKPGDTKQLQRQDSKNFKTDRDIILDNMKFIWNESEMPKTYEERLAKKYYDKLFREYCICDLSRYKENKIANRFRIEKEVISGKGQFICAEKSCNEQENLRTWEVNFCYVEKNDNEKKNALVKIRLCEEDSAKLNYHSKKREIKRLKKNKRRSKVTEGTSREEASTPKTPSTSQSPTHNEDAESETPRRKIIAEPVNDESLWKKSNEPEVRGRDEEFDDYLADLLL